MAKPDQTDDFRDEPDLDQTEGEVPGQNTETDEPFIEIPVWQREILNERLADLERNPDDGQPWDEVRAELLDY
jgi:hypothetical protein